jgi:hypothetical protein
MSMSGVRGSGKDKASTMGDRAQVGPFGARFNADHVGIAPNGFRIGAG